MTSEPHSSASRVPRPDRNTRPNLSVGLEAHVLLDLGLGLLLTLLAASSAGLLQELGASHLLTSTALYLGLSALLLLGRTGPFPGVGLGPANRVTLVRATLVVPVAALLLPPQELSPALLWWVIGVSALAMALDGLDGRLARATGTSTPFGARFDMELDAFLILVLSVLVWMSGQVGAWIILIGAIRYLFVGAGWIWPVLQGSLPPSWRRKAVCVVQGVGLLIALGPIIPPSIATLAAGAALAVLLYSFGSDIRFLLIRGRDSSGLSG
jgi:phosphatidylglycerophosphate synthase